MVPTRGPVSAAGANPKRGRTWITSIGTEGYTVARGEPCPIDARHGRISPAPASGGGQGVALAASPAMDVLQQREAPRGSNARQTVHNQEDGSPHPVRVMNQGGVGPVSGGAFAVEAGRERPQKPPPSMRSWQDDRWQGGAAYHHDTSVLQVMVMTAVGG